MARYVIWSIEHQAWWPISRMGYVETLAAAGRFSFAEATAIVTSANIVKTNECMIPVEALILEAIIEPPARLAPNHPDCICRNPHCGHRASQHVGPDSACLEAGCSCGPGGWR
jgi:hypothetical protein